MAGAFYIWIMLAFLIGCGGVLLLLTGLFFLGHWLEKRRTGATHGFLELPENLRQPAQPPSDSNATDHTDSPKIK
jgi:hypothetical protein